jgi:hypothetical protein
MDNTKFDGFDEEGEEICVVVVGGRRKKEKKDHFLNLFFFLLLFSNFPCHLREEAVRPQMGRKITSKYR